MEVMEFSAGEGKWRVNLAIVRISLGNGVVAILTGGEEPHIGAVAIALPSKLAHHPEKVIISTSVFTVPGHMDDRVATPAAIKIAEELKQPAIVIAGLHIHQATKEDINKLVENSNNVVSKAVKELKKS